jgi:RNA polymerase-binding transcription factor DksA
MTESKTPFDQGMEMWQRMSASYMDTMTKAVEQTMAQSAAFRAQMDHAVATAVSVQLEATLTAIRALEQQVQSLADKVDQLLKKQA